MTTLIREAETAQDWDVARGLISEYIQWIGIDLSFQGINEELEDLDLKFARPYANFYIANFEGLDVGCVGYWKLNGRECEMKRLYVRQQARGKKSGEQLIRRVIQDARVAGYKRLLLDTIPMMSEAQKLYEKSGFIEAEEYRFNPIEGARYLQLPL